MFFSATFSVVIYGLVFGSGSFLWLYMDLFLGVGLFWAYVWYLFWELVFSGLIYGTCFGSGPKKTPSKDSGRYLWVDVIGTINWLSVSRLCECSI